MISFDKRLLRNIDWWLLGSVLAVSLVGLLAIASATYTPGGPYLTSLVKKQIMWIGLGLVVMAAAVLVDYRLLKQFGYLIYAATILMLVAVFVVGTVRKGAQRWIALGPMNLQPSEFAKIFVAICLAKLLENRTDFSTVRKLVPVFLFALPPIMLIYAQPDLGTSIVLAVILFVMLFAAGLHRKFIGYGALAALITAPLAWFFLLRDYQKDRILIFLNPQLDPLGKGYNVIMSRTAIGSGGIMGWRLFEPDTLSSLNFIPEQHTDFIFTVIGEGMGFIGSVAFLLLYFFMLYRCLRISLLARDRFGYLLVLGLTSMLFFHALVNIGMTLGLMPVTGLPLPFVSYGGSSYLTNSLAIGLILNIGMRHKKIMF